MNKNVVLASVPFLCFLLSLVACTKSIPISGRYVFVGQTAFRYDHQYADDTGKFHWDVVDTIYTDTIDMNATDDLVTFGFRRGTPTTAYEPYFGHSFPARQYPSYSYGRLADDKNYDLRPGDSLFSSCGYHMVSGGYTSLLVNFKGKRIE